MCDIRGFHYLFGVRTSIPVAKFALAYIEESGETFILITNQMLYFRQCLNHSLINPNQIRLFGTPISDNPFDDMREFGINVEDLFVQFLMERLAI